MTMTIDLEQALACLNRLASLNMSPWMAKVGQQAQQSVQQRIRQSKQDPDSAAWSPWMPSTEKYRTKKGNAGQGLLWDDGTLLNSIKFHSASDGVSVSSEVPYASYLQDGTERMAARPFMGWSDEDIAGLDFSAVRFIEALL
jgi:phage virion morphogenesis protein